MSSFKNSRSTDNILNYILNIYKPYFWYFVISIFTCLSLAFIYIYYSKPVYEISATLIITDQNKGVENPDLLGRIDLLQSKQIVENEIEVLKSRKIINAVVNELSLYRNKFAHQELPDTNYDFGSIWKPARFALETIIILLAPFSPHIAEELWESLGHKQSLLNVNWPSWDDEKAAEDEIELVVQINGKVRAKTTIPAGLPDDEIKQKAFALDKIIEA
ncbi:hypothetical protein LCGC14_1696910, partial [marine sediment metagenome]